MSAHKIQMDGAMNVDANDDAQPAAAPEGPYVPLTGRASTTSKGYSAAMKWYNNFAAIQGRPLWTDPELTEKWACGDQYESGFLKNPFEPPVSRVLGEFAQFLLGKHKNDGKDFFKPDSQTQYLSGVKTEMFKRFKFLGIPDDSPQWYQDIYRNLQMRGRIAAIDRGETISDQAIGCSRDTLVEMALFLMRENTPLSYEERCILTTLFHAVGRGGEISASTWNSAYFHALEGMLVFDWREYKKANEYVMTFHPDAKSFVIDEFHAIACYLLAGQGRHDAMAARVPGGTNWIFPAYVNMADGGAASKVSRIIEKCQRGGVENIPDGMKSHGIRITAADEMVFNPTLHLVESIMRGGWDFKGESQIFHYLTKKLHIAKAGKVLAGWSDAQVRVSAPSLDSFLTSENKDRVEELCKELFMGVGIPELQGQLKPFRNVMVASLLMYHEEVKEVLQDDALIVKTLNAAAIRCDIRLAELRDWGESVKTQFVLQNAANKASTGTDAERRDNAVKDLRDELVLQKQQNNAMLSEMKTIQHNQKRILDAMGTMTATFEQGSPRKRVRLTQDSDDGTTTHIAGSSVAAAVATESTQVHASLPDANTWLQDAARRRTKPHFSHMKEWTCQKLIFETVKQGIDYRLTNAFGLDSSGSTSRTIMSRGRLVIEAMKAEASPEELKFMDAKNCPKGSERMAFLTELEKFLPSLQDALVSKLQERWAILNPSGKKKTQSVNVGSVGSLLEKINKAERDRASL